MNEETTKFIKEFLDEISIDFNLFKDYYDLNQNKIIENNEGIFISKKNFSDNEKLNGEIIFIKLKETHPTKFLLKFLEKHLEKIEISEKNSIKFTFDKDIIIEDKELKKKILSKTNENSNFLIQFNNKTIGICKIKKEKNKIILENKFNIGKYLKEN
jgi:hypothetical protein